MKEKNKHKIWRYKVSIQERRCVVRRQKGSSLGFSSLFFIIVFATDNCCSFWMKEIILCSEITQLRKIIVFHRREILHARLLCSSCKMYDSYLNQMTQYYIKLATLILSFIEATRSHFLYHYKNLEWMNSRKWSKLPCWKQVSFWKDVEQEEMGKKKRTTGNETTMLLSGLEGNTQYLVSVKGFNSVGQGPASSAIKISTKKNGEFHASNTYVNIINCKINKMVNDKWDCPRLINKNASSSNVLFIFLLV